MLYGDDFFGDPANTNTLEIEAKDELLKIGGNEGWSPTEMQKIRNERAAHEKQLNKGKH